MFRRALYLLLAVLATAPLLASCEKDKPASAVIDSGSRIQWNQIISQHTSGLVSKKARLRVRFMNDVAPEEMLGRSLPDRVEMSPSVDSEVMFTSPRELQIVPKEPLKSGQAYQVRVKTDLLKGLPADLGPFEFRIEAIRQEFELAETGLAPAVSADGSMVMHGNLTTADVEDAEAVEKLISVTYLGQGLPVNWQHNVDGRHHEFSVAGIQRQPQGAALNLAWDGAPIGVANRGSRTVDVPAQGVFKVTAIRPVAADNRYVEIRFSDSLDTRQNMRGMVQLSSGRFTTRIEGNTLKIFPDTVTAGEMRVTVDGAVRNASGSRLGERYEGSVVLEGEKPKVRFVGKGVILPENDRLTIPFEAVNVHSVQVAAFRVFDNNIGQFLQTNPLKGNSELSRVGRYLWRRTIPLNAVETGKWNRYALDATELLRAEPGGLFRLALSINRGNSTYVCSDEDNSVPVAPEPPLASYDDLRVAESSGWDGVEGWYGNQHDDWNDRRNPCKDAYYRLGEGVRDQRNFMASNLGLIAKRGTDGKVHLAATDLRNGRPMQGTAVTLYNFQDQVIGRASTDSEGLAALPVDGTPFYVEAEKGKDRGYLKLSAGNALPVSHFDVGGQGTKQGVKGTLYGERGVWRPGDDIFLTFVLQDKEEVIPANHPVTLELYNPRGRMVRSITNSTPVEDFYAFHLRTAEDDPTGDWVAKARLGGMTFEKSLKIETVVPNRLKIDLDLGGETLYKGEMPLKATLFAQWLHGAAANGLKVEVAAQLKSRPTGFGRFTDFIFDDPARRFQGEKQLLFEGRLDEKGYVRFEKDLLADGKAPGMLTAGFTSRVFEEGGGFSAGSRSIPFHPYENYVGIKLPKGDAVRGMLLTDATHKVEVASLNAKGEPVSLDKVQMTLYKIDWKWWWDRSGDSLARYASASHNTALQQGVIPTRDGKGLWEFEIKYPDWGRYLVRACDQDGDHCTGKVFYCDWPGWAGRAREERGPGASALTLFTERESYSVGEVATVNLPQATQGRALVSIENASGVLEQHWIEMGEGQNSFPLTVTRAMSPNVYVHVTLVQPHAGKANDRPIRLYGVVPIRVEDPQTRLKPQLEVPEEVRPESTATVAVREADGRAMTYTLAVVDEGLLGLTSYRTPDLHGEFYKKEALQVKTWDLFDEVVGAYGGELERVLALGGDEGGEGADPASSKRRFPPVVRFLGPFQLKPGETARHDVPLPQYVGAVRVMVVAGQQGAYGSAEKTTFVRQPLTLLPTLPRVLGPDEEVAVPVALFVMDPEIRDVTLTMEADEHFEVLNGGQVQVGFDQPGDKLGFLHLKVRPHIGKGEIRFKAVSGPHVAEKTVHIDVRSANLRTVRQQKEAVEPGQEWLATVVPHGLEGTNRISLEVSAVPPINLDHRLNYLIRYPHGCIEQTTSAVFPQLYLPTLVQLDPEARRGLDRNVQAGIERLRQFQRPDGGFAYWPGAPASDSWGTNYAGHFLVEAKRLGYQFPPRMLADWQNHQKAQAQAWVAGGESSALDQAYRLYALALAGSPEMGAMNRLRESNQLSNVARWQLAAAYRLVGLTDAARELVARADLNVSAYDRAGFTYGSELRDRAILLNALVLLEEKVRAREMAEEISAELSSDKSLSTQSTAYALLGMARFVGESGAGESFRYAYVVGAREEAEVAAGKPIDRQDLTGFPAEGAEVRVKNISDRTLYATLSAEGVPRAGEEQAASRGLSLKVRFTDLEGNGVEVGRLEQGADVLAEVAVRNLTDRDFDNLALTQIVPSGWQIHNPRFEGAEKNADLDYQDLRDDRIHTYFGLKARQEKSFTALFNASFLGRHYLPGWSVEPMYDAAKFGRSQGRWVEVAPAGAL